MILNKQNYDNNIELLNHIYNNAKISSKSIAQILPKIDNQNLQNTLLKQLSEYQNVANRASDMLMNLNSSPKESIVDNITQKTGMAINTMTNTSSSHIAQVMITENINGVIDLTKKINKNKDCHQNICELCNDLVKIQETGSQNLKQFL